MLCWVFGEMWGSVYIWSVVSRGRGETLTPDWGTDNRRVWASIWGKSNLRRVFFLVVSGMKSNTTMVALHIYYWHFRISIQIFLQNLHEILERHFRISDIKFSADFLRSVSPEGAASATCVAPQQRLGTWPGDTAGMFDSYKAFNFKLSFVLPMFNILSIEKTIYPVESSLK